MMYIGLAAYRVLYMRFYDPIPLDLVVPQYYYDHLN